jgi:hypothetical protein
MLENLASKIWVFMYAFHSWEDDGGHFFSKKERMIGKSYINKYRIRVALQQKLKSQSYERYNRTNL